MKIINNKGVRKNISSFFHSKSSENEYKKYYISIMIVLGVVFFLFSLLVFLLIENVITAILVILIGGIFIYLLKDKYSQLIINKIINKRNQIKKNKELKSKYKYSQLEHSKVKKNKFSKHMKKIKDSIKSRVSKKSNADEDSYIEIK